MAGALAGIFKLSHSEEFRQQVLQLLQVPEDQVESKLAEQLLKNVSHSLQPDTAMNIDEENDSEDDDWHRQLDKLSAVLMSDE